MYLLVKQSPEHRQRDVQHQNPQHHLNLLDETFLLTHKHTDTSPRGLQPSNVTRHMEELKIAFGYRVLLLSPVQPVWPLRLILWSLQASFDGKLQDQKWTFQHIMTQKDWRELKKSGLSEVVWFPSNEPGGDLPQHSYRLAPGCFLGEEPSYTGSCPQWTRLHKIDDELDD